jgi:putative ABC transport system permease protein
MKLYHIAARNVLRNKRRSVLSGIAIAISVMVIMFMYSFLGGFMNDIKNNIFNNVSGHAKIGNIDYEKNANLFPLDLNVANYPDLVRRVEDEKSVTAVAPRIKFGTILYGSSRICVGDIKDRAALIMLFKERVHPAINIIAEKFPASISGPLAQQNADSLVKDNFFIPFLDAIDKIIKLVKLYTPDVAKASPVSSGLMSQISDPGLYGARVPDKTLVNRHLLDETFPAIFSPSPREGKLFTGLGYGVDFIREKSFFNIGKHLVNGKIPEPGSNDMLLTSGLAESMKLGVGDKLSILTKTSNPEESNELTFRISGVVRFPVSAFNSKFFFLPIDSAASLLRMEPGSATEIIILLKNPDNALGFASTLGKTFANEGRNDIAVLPWQSVGYIYSYVSLVDISFAFISLFFFLLGTTVIINTTIMVIYERMREIGTIGAMGMTGGEIVRLFFLEALFISAVSGFAGIILGIGIVIPLSIFGLNMDMLTRGVTMEMSSVIFPILNPASIVFVYVYAVVISSLVSFIPSRRASRIEPVEALRSI